MWGSSHHGPSLFSNRIRPPHSARKRVRLKAQVAHNAAMARSRGTRGSLNASKTPVALLQKKAQAATKSIAP